MPLNQATARDMILLAQKEAGIIGVGQTPLAEDTNDAFTYLQRMTSQWQKRRWMVPSLTDISMPGNGAISNTIGTGGYWNVPRPTQIKGAYFVQNSVGNNPVSFPLKVIYAYEDYIRITIKNLPAFPQIIFYDAQFNPTGTNGALLGNVFVWPIPSSIYTIYLLIESELGWPATLDSVFTLPDEYSEAVHFNLAIRLCSAYQVDVKPSTVNLAKIALQTIKVANTQIPEMQMPSTLRRGKAFSLWNPDGY